MVEPVIYWDGKPTSLHISGMSKQDGVLKNDNWSIDKENYVKLLREKFKNLITFKNIS